jgi:broad specificity phosphatase PhoE
MRLYLIRHGETMHNREERFQGSIDAELTPLGKKQAAALSEYFKPVKIDVTISSALLRAQTTINAILAHHPNLLLQISPSLNEQHGGQIEGQLRTDVLHKWPQYFTPEGRLNVFVTPEGAESYEQVQNRASKFLDQIISENRNSDKTILIVAHGMVNKVLICHLLSLPPHENYYNFYQYNACINEFVIDEKGTHAIRINDTAHLNVIGK